MQLAFNIGSGARTQVLRFAGQVSTLLALSLTLHVHFPMPAEPRQLLPCFESKKVSREASSHFIGPF